jgi:hypothetical protein
MTLRKDLWYLAGFVLVAALLLANLLRPGAPHAFSLPEPPGPPVSISAAGDSAWAVVGNKVYFVTLRSRAELPSRTITVVGVQELR